jgi:hypothetical protein
LSNITDIPSNPVALAIDIPEIYFVTKSTDIFGILKEPYGISCLTSGVLPIISKIIEKHVINSFYEYLSENHLITSSQSGFRPIHSCETAFNCLIDRWLRNIDQGKLNWPKSRLATCNEMIFR